jgi:hypothetical protein
MQAEPGAIVDCRRTPQGRTVNAVIDVHHGHYDSPEETAKYIGRIYWTLMNFSRSSL